MTYRRKNELKEQYVERMRKLLSEEDFKHYLEILKKPVLNSIRVNKLKINPEELILRLEKRGWKIKKPFEKYPEILIIENNLNPGELGRSIEHLLGYYYIQEISSMLSVIALKPKENELILDLCAAPGSKTTQIAAEMNNTGTIIANEVSLGRIKILASNLERCGVLNTIITKKDGYFLCKKLKEMNFKFDKILLDVPCSGEGTLRSSPKTYKMWNLKTVKNLPKIQRNLFISALDILKENGEIIYSTCTHAPEENEGVISSILNEFKDQLVIERIDLPVKTRKGITSWEEESYNEEVTKSCRIYPQDNDTEGFFVAKFKKIK